MKVIKHQCPHCKGKILGMAETLEEAQARANYNYSQHVMGCSKRIQAQSK
jgi:hypothetical protein